MILCCCKHHTEGHIEFSPKPVNPDPEIKNMEHILDDLQGKSINSFQNSQSTNQGRFQLQPLQIQSSTLNQRSEVGLQKVPTFNNKKGWQFENEDNIFHADSPRRHLKNFGRKEQTGNPPKFGKITDFQEQKAPQNKNYDIQSPDFDNNLEQVQESPIHEDDLYANFYHSQNRLQDLEILEVSQFNDSGNVQTQNWDQNKQVNQPQPYESNTHQKAPLQDYQNGYFAENEGWEDENAYGNVNFYNNENQSKMKSSVVSNGMWNNTPPNQSNASGVYLIDQEDNSPNINREKDDNFFNPYFHS